ncbi:MAG: DUF5615 family PIN-like protein [Gemmataceae bacterium]
MPRFLCDNDFHDAIRLALIDRNPTWDVVAARQVGLRETPDPDLLAWAAGQGRMILTHDRNTMTAAASERWGRGESMTGVIVVDDDAPSSLVLHRIELLAAFNPADWDYWVAFVPIR